MRKLMLNASSRTSCIISQYDLGRAMVLQAEIWYEERRLEEAKSEVSHAADVFEKLGATKELEFCGEFLQDVEKDMKT